jgi:hypothetical protein
MASTSWRSGAFQPSCSWRAKKSHDGFFKIAVIALAYDFQKVLLERFGI